MAIKLVISDIDGTLIDETETIPQKLIETVQKCKAQGILFSLATGRTKELVNEVVQKLGISDPYVISNGACIFKGEECLEAHGFSAYPILPIIRRADAEGLTVTIADTRFEKALRLTDYVRGHQQFGNRFQSFIDPETEDWEHATFQKLMIMDEHRTGKIVGIRESLKPFAEQYWITTYSDMAVELGPKGCNKASGVKALVKRLGIQPEEVMACGDFSNDVEMLQYAGIGVAVANASPYVKERADYVATKSYALGVVEAVEKYCLEGGAML